MVLMLPAVLVQEDLLVALGQGSRLLESINEPVVRDPDHNMNQDELENMATVQRSEPSKDWTQQSEGGIVGTPKSCQPCIILFSDETERALYKALQELCQAFK